MNEQMTPAGSSPVERPVRPRGLDVVNLTESYTVRDGLEAMLTAAIGEHAYCLSHVDAATALLVIEAAKRADDREDWFPRGSGPRCRRCRNALSAN